MFQSRHHLVLGKHLGQTCLAYVFFFSVSTGTLAGQHGHVVVLHVGVLFWKEMYGSAG